MPKTLFTRTALAAACAAVVGLGAASADPAGPAAADDGVRFERLPADTRDRFNSPPPEQAVDSKPEIDTLQDRRAEWRFQEQVDRAKAREAMKRRLQSADQAELEVLEPAPDTEAAKRGTMLPGRGSAAELEAAPLYEDSPLLTEDDLQIDETRGLDGPALTRDEPGGSVLQ